MKTVTTWRDQEDEPYTKVINEAFPEPEPEPNTQYPHRPNYVGPSNLGKAVRDPVGDVVTAGLAYGASAAIKPITGMLGAAKTIDMGLNLIDPNASDVALDQAMEFIKPANPIKVGAKGIRIFKNMLTDVFDNRVSPDYYTKGPLNTLKTALTGGPDVGTARDVGGINPLRIPEIPENIGTQMMRSGLKDGIFQLDIWRANSSYRKTMEAFQTDPNLAVKITGKNSLRTLLMPEFLKEFGPYLKKMKQVPGSIDLHHIFGLNLSAPIYDGLRFDSPEYKALNDLFREYNIIPGNTRKNLMLALEEPHDLLHQQFFKDKIGYRGEKFFTQARLNKIKFSEAGRLEVAREYAEIVKQGEDLITRATDQIQAVFGTTSVKPERLTEIFSESLADGTTNIFKEGYTIKSVDKQVKKWMKEIVPDYDAGNVPSALGGKSQSPPTQVPKVQKLTQRQQDLNQLKELRDLVKNNKKNYNKQELAQMKQTIKALSDQLEGKQKNIFDKTGL